MIVFILEKKEKIILLTRVFRLLETMNSFFDHELCYALRVLEVCFHDVFLFDFCVLFRIFEYSVVC